MLPENLVQACFQQVQTSYVKKKVVVIGSANQSEYIVEPTLVYRDGTNVMGMIVFCIIFGVLAGQIGPRGKLMVDFFVVLNEIIMKLVTIVVVWYETINNLYSHRAQARGIIGLCDIIQFYLQVSGLYKLIKVKC